MKETARAQQHSSYRKTATMTKALILNNCGLESFVSSELAQILLRKPNDLNATTFNGAVLFESKAHEELFKFCYLSQSATKVMSLIGMFVSSKDTLDSLLEQISSMDFSAWLSSSRTLAVRTDFEPLNSSRQEFESEIGSTIIKQTSCKVNLSSPDVLIYVCKRDTTVFVGVDFSGADLAKRDYRIFTGRQNIKSPVAAFACHKAGIKKGEVIVDPFCKNGTVVIECTHMLLGRSVHLFAKDKFQCTKMPEFSKISFDEFFEDIDKKQLAELPATLYAVDGDFRHISSSKKNAKIAGVEKMISFSRTTPDWIDTKFEKGEVDHIITYVPQFSKTFSQKEIEKKLEELFYQANFVVSKKGSVVCISSETKILEACAEKHKFRKTFEQLVLQGQESFFVAVFEFKKD